MTPDESSGAVQAPRPSESEGNSSASTQEGSSSPPGDDSTSREESLEREKRESRRSAVRTRVTYLAAGFLFLVGAGVVGFLLATHKVNEAKDVFLAILPVAAAVVTYWFATRRDGAVDPEAMVKLIDAARRQP